jgi:hypothetical protein
MEGSQEGRELLLEIAGKKSTSILDEVDQLTSKYRGGVSSEDVTAMLSKRVTDEILYGD